MFCCCVCHSIAAGTISASCALCFCCCCHMTLYRNFLWFALWFATCLTLSNTRTRWPQMPIHNGIDTNDCRTQRQSVQQQKQQIRFLVSCCCGGVVVIRLAFQCLVIILRTVARLCGWRLFVIITVIIHISVVEFSIHLLLLLLL